MTLKVKVPSRELQHCYTLAPRAARNTPPSPCPWPAHNCPVLLSVRDRYRVDAAVPLECVCCVPWGHACRTVLCVRPRGTWPVTSPTCTLTVRVAPTTTAPVMHRRQSASAPPPARSSSTRTKTPTARGWQYSDSRSDSDSDSSVGSNSSASSVSTERSQQRRAELRAAAKAGPLSPQQCESIFKRLCL